MSDYKPSDDLMAMGDEITRLRAENEVLRAEAEALRKDADRLDWVEKNTFCAEDFYEVIRNHWYKQVTYDSLREAISAALMDELK